MLESSSVRVQDSVGSEGSFGSSMRLEVGRFWFVGGFMVVQVLSGKRSVLGSSFCWVGFCFGFSIGRVEVRFRGQLVSGRGTVKVR